MPELFGNKIKFTKIPIDFYDKSKSDWDNFSRDLLGVACLSLSPLFKDPSKLMTCIDKSLINPLNDNTLQLMDSFQPDPNKNYYMHLDGSEGNDGYGICLASSDGYKEGKQHVRIELLGCPSKRSYGNSFKAELIEEMVFELIDRGFNIKICTYDRATVIRLIKDRLEAINCIVCLMSIDKCTTYPILDYDKPEPPYSRMDSTRGEYYKPMVEFRNVINDSRLTVPYHENWGDISFSFEMNENKKIVTKIPGKLDDLGQACAGACFHVLNNEVDYSVPYQGFEIKESPDTFLQEIEKLQLEIDNRSKKQQIDSFAQVPEIPDEMGIEDDFDERISNRYYL